MASVECSIMMGSSMKANGIKIQCRDEEYIFTLMGAGTKAHGMRINSMDMASAISLKVIGTRGIGFMVKSKVKELNTSKPGVVID